MKRREFIRNTLLGAGVVCFDMPSFAKYVNEIGTPNLRIGILSDIHIREAETTKVFQHALEYFRDCNVDGVLIAGDMADHGLESQLKNVADTWYRVFPKDKAPDGHKVVKLFVYGNHDMEGFRYSKMDENKVDAIVKRKAEVWKELFHEKWEPIYVKDVKGYKFVGAHWYDWSHVPGLDEFMEKLSSKLETGKPFFYFQHAHPKGTCSSPWVWGQDNGEVTSILSRFPNAIAFSGHSHSPLTNERAIWQGAFTSIGTSSLSYLCPYGARENSHTDGSREHEPAQMPVMSCGDGKQGQVMTIYDDCITLERREFVYDQSLGDNWVIPLPCPGNKPFAYENREKTDPIPQFAPDDKVTLTRAIGKDRYGVEQMQITVHFPSVLKKRTGKRAFDYEVQAEFEDEDTYKICLTKRVFSKGFYLGEAQDESEVVCLFGEGELPDNRKVRFIVRPCNSFSRKGTPIYSEWVQSRTKSDKKQ